MKIKIEKEINLESVFVTALEGGSNYWYMFDEDSIEAIRSAVPKSEEPCISLACYKAVTEHNVLVPIYDIEALGCEPCGYLDHSLFEERLTNMANDKSYVWAIEAEADDNGDADSSDVVFQYLIFNDVIYS